MRYVISDGTRALMVRDMGSLTVQDMRYLMVHDMRYLTVHDMRDLTIHDMRYLMVQTSLSDGFCACHEISEYAYKKLDIVDCTELGISDNVHLQYLMLQLGISGGT